jgi:hypothetical protein
VKEYQLKTNDVWLGLIQIIGDTEAISWNRLYNFLMGNSILVLAWATIYTSHDNHPITRIVLTAICVLGGVSGPFWAALSSRTRAHLDQELKNAMEVEAHFGWGSLPKPITDGNPIREGAGLSSNRNILVCAPLLFTILYVVMFVASLVRS